MPQESSGWDVDELQDLTPEQLAEMSNEDLNALIYKAGVGSNYRKYFSSFDADKLDRIQDVMRGRMGELTSANRNNLAKLQQEGATQASMRGFEGAGDIKQRMEAQRAELFGTTQAGRQNAFNQAQEQEQSAYSQYESDFASDMETAETAADADDDDNDGCCFIVLELEEGTGLDEHVRKYRDMACNNTNREGYYKLAQVVVPLMRKYKSVKWFFKYFGVGPAKSYAKWYYTGKGIGWVFEPLRKFWFRIFDYLGQDHKLKIDE